MSSDAVQLLVLVPTRNRADIAVGAVESVLGQHAAGVGVLVSDNSTSEPETERLRTWCETWDVEVIRPPSPLGMGDHWDWAIGRALATPGWTHLVVLTDRAVFLPGGVETVLALAARHPDDVLVFNIDRIDDTKTPVVLEQHGWTGRLLRAPGESLLEASSRCVFLGALPRLLNSCVPRTVVERVRSGFGDVCKAVSPDIRFAYRALTVAGSVLVLDRALMIQRAFARSNGYSHARGVLSADAKDFIRELDKTAAAFETPMPAAKTVVNGSAHEYCAVRRETGGGRLPPLVVDAFFASMRREIDAMENAGAREVLSAQLAAAMLNSAPAAGGTGMAAAAKPSPLQRARRTVVETVAGQRAGPVAELVHRAAVKVLGRFAPRRIECADEAAALQRALTDVRPRRRGRCPLEVTLPGVVLVERP